MAKNLKIGERVTVDRPIELDPTSEPFEKGLPRVEPGHVGVVIGPAPQGHATVVEFSGVQAIISSQRLVRSADKPLGKKRGRKKLGDATSIPPSSSRSERVDKTPSSSVEETSSMQLVTQIANTLLLNGGLKEADDAVIQLRFAELSAPIQAQIRALIEAKLSLSGPVTK